MLHHLGKYNNIPKDQMPDLPEPGTVVTYQFTNKLHDNASGADVYPEHFKIPAFAKAKIKNEKGGEQIVDIGRFGAISHEGIPVDNTIDRWHTSPSKGGGYLRLNIGNAVDNDRYQFLELADIVAGTPTNPTPNSKTILIKKDFAADTRKANEAARRKRDAVTHALSLKGADLTRAGYLLGFGKVEDSETLLNQVWQKAQDAPDEYFEKVDDKDAESKSVLAHAISVGALIINEDNHTLTFSDGATVLDLTNTQPDMVATEWVEYLKGLDKKKADLTLDAIKKATAFQEKKK